MASAPAFFCKGDGRADAAIDCAQARKVLNEPGSGELVQNDTYTSIHIRDFDIAIRETPLGGDEFTRDISNVREKILRNLDENDIGG